MSKRPAPATQSEVERLIRAAKAQGLSNYRVAIRADGVYLETVDSKENPLAPVLPPKPEGIVL